jgi:hypothetical protein
VNFSVGEILQPYCGPFITDRPVIEWLLSLLRIREAIGSDPRSKIACHYSVYRDLPHFLQANVRIMSQIGPLHPVLSRSDRILM